MYNTTYDYCKILDDNELGMNQSRGRKRRPMKCCCPNPSCEKLRLKACKDDRECGKGGICYEGPDTDFGVYDIDFGVYGKKFDGLRCCCNKYPNTGIKKCK